MTDTVDTYTFYGLGIETDTFGNMITSDSAEVSGSFTVDYTTMTVLSSSGLIYLSGAGISEGTKDNGTQEYYVNSYQHMFLGHFIDFSLSYNTRSPVVIDQINYSAQEGFYQLPNQELTVKTVSFQGSNVPVNVTPVSVEVSLPSLAITSAIAKTNPDSQTISGTIDSADSGLTVSIYDGSILLGAATPNADGKWRATVNLLPTEGPQSITAQATNLAGTVRSNALVYTLQPSPPPEFSILTLTTGGGLTVGSGNADVKLFDLSGNDTLDGGAGRESLHVESGDNSLVAGSGLDTLFGGSGDDTLIGGGRSRLIGGAGNESLSGGLTVSADDTLIGGSGDDTLLVTSGSNKLVAGSGSSTLWGGSGDDTLIGGSGLNAVLHAGSGVESMFGGTEVGSSDKMFGGSGQDYMISVAGNDRIIAGGGDDTLKAGDGNDKIWSGTDHDTIYGGSGHDTINLLAGVAALVYAGSGREKILTGLRACLETRRRALKF